MTVEAERITRRFGDAAALDGVDLAVREGELVALLGPSGSGKTTLLRVIAGLEGTDAGRLRIAGQDMAGVPARERGIGVVFQHYALFRHMKVADNIAFGLDVRPRATRPDRAAIADRVAALLDLVQIPELAQRYPDQLSGGQRQRVALARALAIEPRLLLLDEPFGALDALVRRDVRRWVRGLQERLGITTILVTHDQEEAMEMADRVAVMERGRIVQFDAPAALLEHPATPFVAGFIGDAAQLPCRIAGGVAHFDPLPIAPLPVSLADGPGTAFLRPAELLAEPGGSAVVRLLRPQGGGELHLVVEAAGQVLDARAAPGTRLARGDACHLVPRGGRVFPGAT
ncbi:sulfate/molybdate ABC transporter ATP-binding protein [Falsiroseomonas stagni]|uniref:Sulfate transport system ATP-binding protein n=1 Tax=Falsiroseomonas stagni DSM 19981 TaxID=1123062 RepID=A0A1I4DKE4_9PROT|nr:sulfate ABC transporter ATP-binding protein [Falsiroseomonas stagni]SFK94088.1 sulfate transport system ATP-binding protein [Falsiroseomonas stagni DSM 19981]